MVAGICLGMHPRCTPVCSVCKSPPGTGNPSNIRGNKENIPVSVYAGALLYLPRTSSISCMDDPARNTGCPSLHIIEEKYGKQSFFDVSILLLPCYSSICCMEYDAVIPTGPALTFIDEMCIEERIAGRSWILPFPLAIGEIIQGNKQAQNDY